MVQSEEAVITAIAVMTGGAVAYAYNRLAQEWGRAGISSLPLITAFPPSLAVTA